MAKLYIGDIGTLIEIDLGENISTASGLKLEVEKPDNTRVEWTPTLYGTNYLRYTTVSGDLNVAGRYGINPTFTLGTWIGRCDTVFFEVHSRYD